jgi:DNA-binding MarR family transcriptional regulator
MRYLHQRGARWADGVLVDWWPNRRQSEAIVARAKRIRASPAARKRYGFTHAAKDTLAALLTFLNFKDGRCFPTIARLAEEADYSVRQVQYALNALEAAGLIRRTARKIAELRTIAGAGRRRVVRQVSNQFTFLPEAGCNDCAGNIEQNFNTILNTLSLGLCVAPRSARADRSVAARLAQRERARSAQPDLF